MSNKVRNIVRYAVMLVALCVFGYSAYRLADIYITYEESKNVYEDIQNNFFKPVIDSGGEEATDSSGDKINLTGKGEGQEFVFDFKGLKKTNKYAVGWISLDNGEYISYPVLQCEDNDKYLRRLITGQYNTAGSIFIDYRCEGGFESRHAIVYGHNMRDLSMFGTLKYFYDDPDYYKEHPSFDIWVGEKRYRYDIFSIYHLDLATTDTYQFSFETDEKFLEYVEKRKELSITPIDVGEITAEDKIVTLSTCVRNHEEQRLVMHLVQRPYEEPEKEENKNK